MRLEKLTIRGLGPFKNEVSLDLTTVDHKILAVTGANGRGKSTLLELALGGALYRECPTRGSLASLANRRDAFVEVQVVNGQRCTVRQLIDGVSGKGETVLLDEAGNAINSSGKLREADAWIARKILPPEVVYSSIFAHQGSAGFLDLKPAERKRVLLRVLGIERLEAMAEKARERVRATKEELRITEARLADERARGVSAADAETALKFAVAADAEAGVALFEARERLAVAQTAAALVEETHKSYRAAMERVEELERRADELAKRDVDLQKRVDNNRGVLARGDEIRDAVARAAELDVLIREADLLNAQLRENRANAEALWKSAHAEASRAATAVEDAKKACRDAGLRADALRAKVDAAREAMPAALVTVEAAKARRARAAEALEWLQSASLVGATERIASLRGALTTIVAASGDLDNALNAITFIGETASSALDTDDMRVAQAESFPARLAEAKAESLSATLAERDATDALARLKTELASAGELARLDTEADHWQSRIPELQARADEALELDEARKIARDEWMVRPPVDASDAKANRSALEPLLKLAAPLAQAEARLAELLPQLRQVQDDLAAASDEAMAAALSLPAAPNRNDSAARLDVAQEEARRLERVALNASNAVAVAEKAVADAKARAGVVAKLEAESRETESTLADWTRLAADLGKDGVQALEVDAAGPELSTLVNELLHTCHGPRFTVSIETTKLSSDGKRQLEGCEVWVLDTVGGREGPVETFSGGERVLVGEAVSLALSVMACRRAGLERPTLVRDETGAALDPVNGRAYVAMLRLAADMVDADKVLFVSHSPELQELADARIVVAEGGLSVE